MRVAINLLTDDPAHPSGAHWFWTRTIKEMVPHLAEDEELHLLTSRRSRATHQGYGAGVRYITFPWSNEHPELRTLSEHALTPLRLPLSRIDVFSTLLAPVVKPAPSLVVHFKTLHAYTSPQSLRRSVRLYRRMSYPRTARVADAVIINSESLRSEVERYLDVDPAKLRLIPEAVDHDLFHPGDPDESRAPPQGVRRRQALRALRLLAVALQELRRTDPGLRGGTRRPRRAPAGGGGSRPRHGVRRGPHALAEELGVADDVVWVGGVPLEETVHFYRAADVFVYPSFNETFGLPLLEAMACGCPVVTSDTSAMPETAGDAALLSDPRDPASIAAAIVRACGSDEAELRRRGPRRAAEFTWAVTGQRTLEVYREVHRARRDRS